MKVTVLLLPGASSALAWCQDPRGLSGSMSSLQGEELFTLVFEVAQDRFPESRLVTEGKTWLNKTLHCSFEALGVTAHEIKGFFPLLS